MGPRSAPERTFLAYYFRRTGFSPPYLNPKPPLALYVEAVPVKMDDKIYTVKAKTAGKFLQSMQERWQKPAAIFSSRDLEDGLGAFVQAEMAQGAIPTDEALRAKAREILSVNETAADDVLLLEKFKSLHNIPTSRSNIPSPNLATEPIADYSLPNFTEDVSMLAGLDMELGAMDLTTDFGKGTNFAPDMHNVMGVDMGQQGS
jgi:hypothetical protein